MTLDNSDVFKRFRHPKKSPSRQEADGHEVDVREDEEQSVKLQEIIDLLLAAGYFRARIKGLSPFDKVVGGMTWCIESCNVDVDVDLLFQENSTIGQKIALTEKIVAVLPKMKCPHAIEPHQIQGLDFIHIFPVIQWLVKRSMEFRQEMSSFVRSYAVNQFQKYFGGYLQKSRKESNMLKNVQTVCEMYRPRRYFKSKNNVPHDVNTQVQITLLEYGHRGKEMQSTHNNEVSSNEVEQKEEQKIQQLLSNLTVNKDLSLEKELNEEDLESLAKHYSSLQLEFKSGGSKLLEEKQKLVLGDQIKALSERCAKLETKKQSLEAVLQKTSTQLEEVWSRRKEGDGKLKELELPDAQEVKEVEELILLSDSLKCQESQFRDHCKREHARLQELIQEAKKTKSPVETNSRSGEIEELTENVRVLRLQLAKKNRTVAVLQRHIDDVPNRPELAQYQRRFLELYNQVSAKHRETKQYYTLYNTLEDTKLYMKKELSLLNSISDSYPEALLSNSGKDEFLNQFQNIVEGMRQSKERVNKRLVEEKRKRDHLSSSLQSLVEQQRKYVAAVRQLSIECKRHEALLAHRKF